MENILKLYSQAEERKILRLFEKIKNKKRKLRLVEELNQRIEDLN